MAEQMIRTVNRVRGEAIVSGSGVVSTGAGTVIGGGAVIGRATVAGVGSETDPQQGNLPPVVGTTPDFTIEQGRTRSLAQLSQVSDPNNDVLTAGLAPGYTFPPGVSMAADGTITAAADAPIVTNYGPILTYWDDGVGDTVESIQMISTAPSGSYAFNRGVSFNKGVIPANFTFNVSGVQAVVRRRWSDGSVKIAHIAGEIALTQNTWKPVTIVPGTPTGGAALTHSNIVARAPTASIAIGGQLWSNGAAVNETITLTSLLAAAPWRTWVSGPEMVECIYLRRYAGTQLDAWFHVRLWKSGKCQIEMHLKNGSLQAFAGISISITVMINGVQVWTHPGIAVSYRSSIKIPIPGWHGTTDPNIAHKGGLGNKLVPNYPWGSSEAALNSIAFTYIPGSHGPWTENMPNPGTQHQLGIIPRWDAVAVASKVADMRAWMGIVHSPSFLHSYGMNTLDQNTRLPITPTAFPNWSLGGPGAGVDISFWRGVLLPNDPYGHDAEANALVYEIAHSPSTGYLAYLMTGNYEYHELMAKSTAWVYLESIGGGQNGVNRITGAGQIRGIAWFFRQAGQYLATADDGDPVAADYRSLLSNNVTYWYNATQRQGASQIGYPVAISTQNPNAPLSQSIFMYHFWMTANGHLDDIEVGFTGATLTHFNTLMNFMWQGIVGVFGPENDTTKFAFTRAGENKVTYSSVVLANFDWLWPENFYQTWGEVRVASGWPVSNNNTLQGTSGSAPIYPEGYWAQGMSALAFAVDRGFPGAQASFNRLIGATNWPGLRNSGFEMTPQFGIGPRNWIP